jgi:hypothetical protein
MAVIEDAHIRTRLATMLEDPRVQVGLLLPQGYCGLIMSIDWTFFEDEYGINLVRLYSRTEVLSQEMVDAFSVELGWAEASGKPSLEEDIWL